MDTQLLSHKLLQMGIGFRTTEGNFIPPSIDNDNPILNASDFFLDNQVLGRTFRAWKQWRKFVSAVMKTKNGQEFISQFFAAGTPSQWNDRERSEFDLFSSEENYFSGPHVTRIDFALNGDNRLLILDPNTVPYGLSPMVATQELYGVKTHLPYLDKLSGFNGTWVVDGYHGSASSMQWLTQRAVINFSFSEDFTEAENVIRLSRRNIKGSNDTVSGPGIRVFESQVWSALMSIPGFGEAFGFNVDLSLHRLNCVPCFLLRTNGEKVQIAFSFEAKELRWLSFPEFASLQWPAKVSVVFLKCLSTSGCHQVTWSTFTENRILQALKGKLGGQSNYYLLQPALPCVVNSERVRVASYIGPDGEHYGSEVTRVPIDSMLAHSGEHAKESYLVF